MCIIRSIVLVLLIGLAASAKSTKYPKISTKQARQLYEEFKRKYNKEYSNDAEEFVKLYTSLPAQESVASADVKYNVRNMPKSVDWREKGAVTPVEDQGQCGSCWAFSAIGNVEGQWFRKTGQLVRLSKQQLLDCDQTDQGCQGGLPIYAFGELQSMGGVQAEADYPYEAKKGECRLNTSEVVAKVTGFLGLGANEREQAAWLAENGPLSVALNAALLQFYVKGVIFPWPFICPASNINHGVLTVGYDDSLLLPHWIVKNSWGPQWGEQGYFRIYKGLGSCGINKMVTSAIV